MKVLAAFTLIVISLASAEPPRYRPVLSRQADASGTAPYSPRGWRPSGPSFNIPERSGNQQNYPPPNPNPSYGPPPEPQPSYGPPSTEEVTTQGPLTTTESLEAGSDENRQVEKIEVEGRSKKDESSPTRSAQNSQPGGYFVLLPQVQLQRQNLILQVTPTTQQNTVLSTPVAEIPTETLVQPVSVKTQKTAALVAAPLQWQNIVPITSAFRNEIYTPFSSSLLQIYQI
ncbi:hypothetical protein HHI36_010890 [Cryptolaemus montrouzieri]|uniref:DUF4794 domain-containing protein n=1 Tax=Cryptolaemus montrouzieri TaxID=559131 RepID=A0ABD2MK70_9CUCU